MLLFCLTFRAPAQDRERVASAEKVFARHVWPVLQTKCFPCHGEGKELAGGLDLRSADRARQGGDSGVSAIAMGRREQSSLWRAISRNDPEFSAMPPKENDRLGADELKWIGEWLDAGAPWPDDARRRTLAAVPSDEKNTVEVVTSGGLSPEWTNRRYKLDDLWAYEPLQSKRTALAASHPIDSFLAARMQELKVDAAPRADRRTLIRRATFDLLGLPPTAEEVADFLADPGDDELAFSRVVDRLLASPQYGEHWGRHWLDVTRYADSSGFANDYERGNAWRYRDYVVRALNSDKPYDQFIREQIAGDEIDPGNAELVIAVGFLRMGPWELTGMEVAKVARQRFLDDVTDIVGQVFLAHPLQCARCHDHKFDPVPTRDYYQVQAIFGTTQLAERSASFLPEENRSGFEERKFLEQRKRKFEETLEILRKKEEDAARKWCAERGYDYVPRQQGLRRGVPEDRLPPKNVGFSVQDYGMERIARKGLERLRWELERYEPYALSVYSGATPDVRSVNNPIRYSPENASKGTVERTAILAGGDPFSPTEAVPPRALSALESLAGPEAPRFPDMSEELGGRRLALANWIAHPRNPLTARVIANRVWQWHFGQPLAGSPNNFGTTGKKPTHPELLDWLAQTLIEREWSLKAMHRLIMTSEAYQRSSDHPDAERLAARDAAGTSYAAFRPRRLSAEELRESLLSVSGELNLMVGGIPSRPEIHSEVAMQPRQVMGTFASAWQPSPLPHQRHRRSLYTLRIRGLRDPHSEIFNEPSPDLSCEAREASTITPQVFGLFNSAASYHRALMAADKLLRANPTPIETIERLYQAAFGRSPTETERSACLGHWERMTERHQGIRFDTVLPPKEVNRVAVEENTGEKFEFIETLEFATEFVPDLQFKDVPPKTRALAEVVLVLFNANEFAYVY